MLSIKFITLSLHYKFLQKNTNSSFSLTRWTSIKTTLRKRMRDLKPLSAAPVIMNFVLVIHTVLPPAPNFSFFLFFFLILRCILKPRRCFLSRKRNSWRLLSGEIIDSIKNQCIWNMSSAGTLFWYIYYLHQLVHLFCIWMLVNNNCISQWIDFVDLAYICLTFISLWHVLWYHMKYKFLVKFQAKLSIL